MTVTSPSSVRVRACAKINVTLRVLGVRDDGYHELRTTFQSLALYDTLTVSVAPGPFVLTANDPACPVDETNLVWKAAEGLWRAAGRRGALSGVRAHLVKRIPSEAGLGGGSSDAAAALVALRALWRTGSSDAELETVARTLGADVPFFLHGGTVLGVERGDLLFPLNDLPRAWVVLARPDFGVGTRDAYRWWDERRPGGRSASRRRAGGPPPGYADLPASEWTNDLEAVVVARHPRIGQLIGRLRRAGASFAAMSGSGSAVFGLFADRTAARSAADRLRSRSVRVWVTRTLSRREFRRYQQPFPFLT